MHSIPTKNRDRITASRSSYAQFMVYKQILWTLIINNWTPLHFRKVSEFMVEVEWTRKPFFIGQLASPPRIMRVPALSRRHLYSIFARI